MNKRQLIALAGAFTLFAVGTLFAKPANPNAKKTIHLTNGDTLTILQYGDEHYHYATTTDGYLVVGNGEGAYVYAKSDGSASDIYARNLKHRKSSEKSFLRGINKDKSKSAHKSSFKDSYPEKNYLQKTFKHSYSVDLNANSSVPAVKNRPTGESFAVGEHYIPVLLITTSDKSGGDSTLYYRFLNEKGFSDESNYGSLRDYYLVSSNGKFSPHFDVYPITLPNAFSSYTEATFTKDALDLLVKRSDYQANKTKYDNPAPFIYLYPGMESYALTINSGYWGHQYWMQYNGASGTTYGKGYCVNNYCFDKYLFIAQKEDDSNDKNINQLGIFAHEFSHVLGLADHYGYDSSNNFVTGPAPYDVMTQGMYNGNGRYPPKISALEAEILGWLTPVELTAGNSVYSLRTLDSLDAYSITNPNNSDEYYVVEYRPAVGFDSKIKESYNYLSGAQGDNGVLVWYFNYDSDYTNNNPNGTSDKLTVKQVLVGVNTSAKQYASFSFSTSSGTSNIPGVYSVVKDGNNRACFTVNSSVSISSCPESSSSVSSSSQSSSSVLSSSSILSSSSALSSSSLSSSSSIQSSSSALVVATLTKTGSGSSIQSVKQGSSITSFGYKWTNATSVSVTGLPEGLTYSINTSRKTVTISGTVSSSASVGAYTFTVTTTGADENATLSGTITVNEYVIASVSDVSGSTNQTLTVGSAIETITYKITGATSASITGLAEGLNTTSSVSGNVLTVTIYGTVSESASAGSYTYTLTTTGADNNTSAQGTFTLLARALSTSSEQSSSSSVLSSSSALSSSSLSSSSSIASSSSVQGVQLILVSGQLSQTVEQGKEIEPIVFNCNGCSSISKNTSGYIWSLTDATESSTGNYTISGSIASWISVGTYAFAVEAYSSDWTTVARDTVKITVVESGSSILSSSSALSSSSVTSSSSTVKSSSSAVSSSSVRSSSSALSSSSAVSSSSTVKSSSSAVSSSSVRSSSSALSSSSVASSSSTVKSSSSAVSSSSVRSSSSALSSSSRTSSSSFIPSSSSDIVVESSSSSITIEEESSSSNTFTEELSSSAEESSSSFEESSSSEIEVYNALVENRSISDCKVSLSGNILTINSFDSERKNIQIFDMLGNRSFAESFNELNHAVNIAAYAGKAIVVRVSSNGKVLLQKRIFVR